MKCLLLPLLTAIALPTSVEANPFSGDVILKTNLGEKFLIKKKTVKTLGEAQIGEIIEFFEKQIESEFTSKKNKLKEQIENLYIESDPLRLNWLRARNSRRYDDPIVQNARKKLDRIYGEIKNLEEKVNELRESKNKKDFERKILNDNLQKRFSNNVLVERISFRPIKTDLNNTQYVFPEFNIQCINPKFENDDLKNIIYKYVSANSFINFSFGDEYLKQFNYDAEERICDKFAKF